MTRADLDIRTRLGSCGSPTDLGQMLARSVAALPFLPRRGTARGYRIFSLRDDQLAYCDLAEGAHVVIGRHSLSDVVLDAPSTALRHVLLWAMRRNGKLILRGHDLIDGKPIHTGPVFERARDLDLQGPLAFHAGNEPIVALPDFGIDPVEASSHAGILTVAAHTIVRMAPAIHAPWLTIDLTGPGGTHRLERSQQSLQRAVLIGRYSRCEDGSGSVFSANVSRVHAAIVRDEDGVLVFDLRSSNGLQAMRRSVRQVHVASRALIQLGESDAIEVTVNPECAE